MICCFKKYIGREYGGYTIHKCIGGGRYGICFLAYSIDAVPVVLKRFKPAMFKKNKDKNAYEAVLLSQLSHHAIPALLGVIHQKGFYGFVLEYKQGSTIKELLFKDSRIFSEDDFFSIGIQLIGILKYIHGRNAVHRDIRISNVLLHNNEIFLIDFGLARWADTNKYTYDVDYSYLGDFLLYLLYSGYTAKSKAANLPWYKELPLTASQTVFLKKLLRIESPYTHIKEIEADFIDAFQSGINMKQFSD